MGTEKPSEGKGGWIWHRGISEDQYYKRHELLRTEHMDMEDVEELPDSNDTQVFSLDMSALHSRSAGKWMIFRSPEEIDELWENIVKLINLGKLWKAKVSSTPNEEGTHVAIVYTPNYLDEDDVWRVRDILRHVCGATETLYYKPDIYTDRHIYSDNKDEHSHDKAYRYKG